MTRLARVIAIVASTAITVGLIGGLKGSNATAAWGGGTGLVLIVVAMVLDGAQPGPPARKGFPADRWRHNLEGEE